MSHFVGDWQGHSEGLVASRVYLRIRGDAQRLDASAFAFRSDANAEAYKFRGHETSATEADFEIATAVADGIDLFMPRRMTVKGIYDPALSELHFRWATDIGTLGTAFMLPATARGRFVLAIPFPIHALYRYTKRFTRRYFRYGYLLFVVALALLSIIGMTPAKISTTEAVLLLAPLVFLFRDKMRDLMLSLRVRKAGPIEFFEEQPRSPAGNVDAGLYALGEQFGEHLSRLLTVSRFLVPRSKYLLTLMAHFGRPLSDAAFRGIARNAGVPENNIDATRDALISAECIETSPEGEYVITQFGRLLLLFELRAAQLLTG
jgi:hypothetical protein